MDFINTIMEFFRVFVAWVLALFTTTPPVITPPVITTDFSTGVAKMDLSPGIAKMDLSPGIAKMDLSPGIAKMDLSPGIAKMDLSPGIAKMDLSPGIAKMDLSAGIAKMTLFSPISVPVVVPPTPVVPKIIKPLPPNSLVLINDGREYQIKGKYKNQDVTLFDDVRFGKGSSDAYTLGQVVLFRFTDPATKEENFVNLKMTKFYTKFEDLGFFTVNAKYFTAQIVEGYENSFIGIH